VDLKRFEWNIAFSFAGRRQRELARFCARAACLRAHRSLIAVIAIVYVAGEMGDPSGPFARHLD
jgi:hypothetical protein